VTLAFLGHRPEEDVEAVRAVLAAVAAPGPPELALGDGLLLPPRRARVLTVALVDGSGALGGLQARVAGGLSDAGVFEPEARPFRPHVTVARLRPGGVRAPREIEVAPEPVAFTGGPVVLFRSHVRRGGAMYEPLVTRTL
jgi:2'-5' RNA ligase